METTATPAPGSVLDLATTLRTTLETTLRRLGYEPNPKALDVRRAPMEGRWGYSSAVCKSLSKGPDAAQALAQQVVEALPAHPLVQHAEAVKGFVNFYVAVPTYANGLLDEVRARGAQWGQGQPKPGRVMVEFAQPNTHKAVHVGHLRNIILGEAVVRIMRAAGHDVLAATYPGDIGMHVIKCLWCYLTFHNGEEPETGRGRWLSQIYAESDAKLEYRKHVLGTLAEALQAPALAPTLTAWLRAHGETSPQAASDVQALLAVAATAKPDPDPDTAHEPDEDLAPDLDLSNVSDATVLALWDELGAQLPADDPLRADWVKLNANRAWWPQVLDWRAAVRALFAQWEAKEPSLVALWERTRQWSLDEFADVFRTLDVSFDVYFYESQVEEEGRGIVEELIKRGIATDLRAEGQPVIVKIDDRLREHPALREKYADKLYKRNKDGTLAERSPYRVLVVLRSDGTTLYATKDLALARRKFEDYKVDTSIYVIDVRQSLYFDQVFKVLELYGFEQADHCIHLGYEIVGTKTGAFSSRKGNVPLYEDFLREAIQHARAEIDRVEAETRERNPDAPSRYNNDAEKDAVAQQIALGAIKYTMLDKDNNTVIVFDWEQVLNPRLQSAPYLMYAHARASSVLGKAADSPNPPAPLPSEGKGGNLPSPSRGGAGGEGGPLDFSRLQLGEADLTAVAGLKTQEDRDPEKRRLVGLLAELTLLDTISRYPDEVQRAAETQNPVILTRYLFTLAEAFNKFWDTSRILNAETAALTRSRLALTAAARQTLANGLNLLAIAAPDAM